jgi:phosphohistidine phosphatase
VKTIYLLRHAKAESAVAGEEDIDRRLSLRGLEDCENIGRYIKARKYTPALIAVSPARRTKETFELVMRHAGMVCPSAIEKRLYAATPDRIVDFISQTDDNHDSLMIVGHNPGMHLLALSLVEPQTISPHDMLKVKYPTGTLTVIQFTMDSWQDITHTKGKLIDFMIPADL